MKILGIIPARYASTRFPAKALADIAGKSMVQRVYEQAMKVAQLHSVIVATDHERIYTHVQNFGGKVIMTSPQHPSGTDRCFEAYQQQNEPFDYVINIQGDEPFIRPEQISLLAQLLDGKVQIATLVKQITDHHTLHNPNTPKVVLNTRSEALYFSRQTIPYLRNIAPEDWSQTHTFYKHIGIYAYRSDVLAQITQLPPSPIENAEALEQLRWLENGYTIKVTITPHDSHGIDTPEDLERIKQFL